MSRRWWKQGVIYQVYIRSFADSNGDGIGDLEGLRSRLDHLDALGVAAIWLTPIHPSSGADSGYDVTDYQAVDSCLGSLAQFDELLADLHRRGMRLILDLVASHTSDEHPWFAESRASRDSPKRSWYWWRPPRPGREPGTAAAEPNNWGSIFSGSAWHLDERTGEYYLHLFSARQPDLNWENAEVRRAIHGVMRWWLDRGVDGFRIDCLNMLSRDPSLPDAATTGRRHPYGDFAPFVFDGPRLHEYLREMRAAVRPGRSDLVLIGETPGVTVGQARLLTDPRRAELDMVLSFEHVQLDQGRTKWEPRPVRLPELKACFARWQTGLGKVGWSGLYWSSHDQPRAVSRFGDDGEHRESAAKALATVLHLQRGTPFVYQGEELGMTNAPVRRIEDVRDVEALNHYRAAIAAGQEPPEALADLGRMGRDNARTPMQWDASPHAGFTTGEPWIAVNPNYREINAAAARADPDSVFHWYRRLIELRSSERAVVDGDFELSLPDDDQLFAFSRRLGRTELLVIVNCSGRPARAVLAEAEGWAEAEVLLASDAARTKLSRRELPLPDWRVASPDLALEPSPDLALEPSPALELEPWGTRVLRRVRTETSSTGDG